jgi:hypothetical protein
MTEEQPSIRTPLEAIRTMATLIGLRPDFLAELLLVEVSDWSFVVKAHALLESVVCQLLATHLQRPEIEDVLAQRVQMEDRIEILKALNLVSSSERQMMRLLGKLRNQLVHNVQQTISSSRRISKTRTTDETSSRPLEPLGRIPFRGLRLRSAAPTTSHRTLDTPSGCRSSKSSHRP